MKMENICENLVDVVRQGKSISGRRNNKYKSIKAGESIQCLQCGHETQAWKSSHG